MDTTGYIIAVANNKGGVGKTTVSCNLSHALARNKKRVLVIDADAQCNTTSIMMNQKTNITSSLYEIYGSDETMPIEEAIYPTDYENVYCIPNVEETAGLEPEMIRRSSQSLLSLKNKIRDYAIKNFDFTIIDTPPNLGTFVITALYSSDFVIVPDEVDSAFSHEGLVKAMRLIMDIKQNGNQELRFLRLLMNKVDKRTTISRVGIQHVKKTFKPNQYFDTTIPNHTAIKQAESLKQTILKYKPSAPGSKVYRSLAKELIKILSPN